MKKHKLALLGCGYLNRIVATAWKAGHLPDFTLEAVMGQNRENAKSFGEDFGCKVCYSVEELMETKPDFVAEAASVEGVRAYGEAILKGGANLVVLSIGAFADSDFYTEIAKTAQDNSRRVYIASGAVGGFDILRVAALMSPVTASIHSHKNPLALRGTPLFSQEIAVLAKNKIVFEGSTKEAIKILPTHLNVAIATALASAGPEGTQMKIEAVPGFKGDEYFIKVVGEEVRAELDIYSATSEIAAWSVVATLQNAVSPIVF